MQSKCISPGKVTSDKLTAETSRTPRPRTSTPGGATVPPRDKSKGPTGRVSSRTRDLAKTMNADVVEAQPLEKGTNIDNVIIPPGAINCEKTTIVSIPQPTTTSKNLQSEEAPIRDRDMFHSTAIQQCPNTSMNKSVQAIADTLDEQVRYR